jgi:hypothetical protein
MNFKDLSFQFGFYATLFHALRTAGLVAMGCRRRTQRSLINVHFLVIDAGWCRHLRLVGMHI